MLVPVGFQPCLLQAEEDAFYAEKGVQTRHTFKVKMATKTALKMAVPARGYDALEEHKVI